MFDVVKVDARIVEQAIDTGYADYENAVQHACAMRAKATHLVTRDVAGFRRFEVPVAAPVDYLGTRLEG